VVDLESFDTKKHREELLALRAKRAKKLKAIKLFQVFIGLLAFVALLVLLFRFKGEGDPSWKAQIESTVFEQEAWLETHGLGIELIVFHTLKTSLGEFLSNFGDGFVSQILFETIKFLLLLSFFVIASFRLVFAGGILGFVFGYYSKAPYEGFDLLGSTGIGRLFFSGIRVSKDDVEAGKLIPGMVTLNKAKDVGELEEVFTTYNVKSKTARELAQIIKAYEDWPDGADKLLSRTKLILAEALSIKTGKRLFEPVLSIESSLTRKMKHDIQMVEVDILAVLVLALKAGHILTYDKSGQQVSKFPQLNSRAVLHSISEYSSEFNPLERTAIRRSIIYASRESLLAPVRFPSDLSPITVAMRQISETILFKTPETELFGLVYEAHALFEERFSKIRLKDAYLADSVLLVPVKEIVQVMRDSIPEVERKRIIELALIDRGDKLDRKGDVVSEEEGHIIKSNLIIPKPLSERKIEELAITHKLETGCIKEWIGLRSVLLSFGWLARRIGESMVPDTSVVACSFQGKSGVVSGLVPLRRSRVGLNIDYPFVESPRIDG
jgi:hypothetical protein